MTEAANKYRLLQTQTFSPVHNAMDNEETGRGAQSSKGGKNERKKGGKISVCVMRE